MLEPYSATPPLHALAIHPYCEWMTTLADRIKRIMDETGYTQQQVGDCAGVSAQAVSQWQDGQTKNIRMETLYRLADGTGYAARWIATGEGNPYSIAEKDPRYLIDIGGMSPDQQAIIRAVVDATKKPESLCG